MNEFLIIIATALASYIGSSTAISRKKFKIEVDEKEQTITLKADNPNLSGKAVFLPDADQKKLSEMDKPKKLQKFLKRFVKPKK